MRDVSTASQRNTFPFLESLLSFTELDIGKVAVALRRISDDVECLDRERVTNAMVKLGALAEMHSFFRVLYTKWFYLRSVGFKISAATVSDALDELRTLSEELPLYQKLIQLFFELVLDIDKTGRIGDSEFYVWMEPLYRFLYTYLCYNLCKHPQGAILKGDITMYYAKNTKVCATCGYWGGERRVVSNGNSSEPTSTSAKCQHPAGPNRNCARPGSNTCPCWTLWPPLQ